MCYRGGRGVVPPAGIRPGQMIVKFHRWPRDMATQMCLWHIVMAEPLHKRHPLPRQMALGNVNAIQAWQTTDIYNKSWKHLLVMTSFVVRRFVQHEETPSKTLPQTAAIFTHANSS